MNYIYTLSPEFVAKEVDPYLNYMKVDNLSHQFEEYFKESYLKRYKAPAINEENAERTSNVCPIVSGQMIPKRKDRPWYDHLEPNVCTPIIPITYFLQSFS